MFYTKRLSGFCGIGCIWVESGKIISFLAKMLVLEKRGRGTRGLCKYLKSLIKKASKTLKMTDFPGSEKA